MSQSRNPPDTQALLQSMLQRLKLQPGKEGQSPLHTPVPNTAASTQSQDGERGASDVQKVNASPAGAFEFGNPSNKFGISAADCNFGLKGREIQQPGHGCEVDRGLISFPTQKDNIDGDTGENRVLEQATQPGITPSGQGQLFPVQVLKDADVTSFERTDGERVSFGRSAITKHNPGNKETVTSMGQNHAQDQGFTRKVYTWSLKPTDANLDTGSRENEVFHMGNGGFGALAQSKDMQIVPTGQETTNSGSRRQQRSSENKTRRWTQKIKARWKDRPGSFGKKGKEEGRKEDQKSEQGMEISLQNQQRTQENLNNTSNKEEKKAPQSLYSSETPPTYIDGATDEGRMSRSYSDFEFGLGSFSLLEEIVTGQEWAKFLNPNQSAASANQRPTEEPLNQLKIPQDSPDSGRPSLILNQRCVNNQWSLTGTEASPVSDFSMAQISPDGFQPVIMDVSEGKQVSGQDDQSEPMEHGHTRRPRSFVQPAGIEINSALKSRVFLSRKRQYQSAERRDERLQTENISDGQHANRDRSVSSPSMTGSHVMEETGESHHDDVIPLYTQNSSPLSFSSSSSTPAPRGVLKHSISQNSEFSMEIMTKRRRVEENRRVRFSEEVQAIAPPELDFDAIDSEEDSEVDDDSVIEQECEVEQAAIEVVAPARRTAIPAWILALKRKKHR